MTEKIKPLPLSLGHSEINRLTGDQIAAWLHRRLHGKDTLAPLDPRIDEFWHLLFLDLYENLDGDFRRTFRAAVIAALEDALKYPNSEKWSAPESFAELLMLAPDIINDGSREDLVHASQLLLSNMQRLPWRATSPIVTQLRPRLRSLIALVELAWNRIPANLHPPTAYWEKLWEPDLQNPEDPAYGYAGEQAALIFEGIEKTQRVDDASAAERYNRIEAAFRWLGGAKPWREEYLLSAFKSLLPALLHRYPAAQIAGLLENETLPRLPGDEQRGCLVDAFASVTFPGVKPLHVDEWLGQAIVKVSTSAMPKPAGSEKVDVYCDGLDLRFAELMQEAADSDPDNHPNSPRYRKLNCVTNYLRNFHADLCSRESAFNSRFERLCRQAKQELDEAKRRTTEAITKRQSI